MGIVVGGLCGANPAYGMAILPKVNLHRYDNNKHRNNYTTHPSRIYPTMAYGFKTFQDGAFNLWLNC